MWQIFCINNFMRHIDYRLLTPIFSRPFILDLLLATSKLIWMTYNYSIHTCLVWRFQFSFFFNIFLYLHINPRDFFPLEYRVPVLSGKPSSSFKMSSWNMCSAKRSSIPKLPRSMFFFALISQGFRNCNVKWC